MSAMTRTVVACFGMAAVLSAVAVSPFAAEPPPYPGIESWTFRDELAKPVKTDPVTVGEPWVKNRISRCFFGPIKRAPLFHDELMDDVDYYPDAYLDRLAGEGVNGLWLTIEWRDLATTSFAAPSPDAPGRIAKLRRTVDKCLAHGIKIWAFCIEPKAVRADDPLFVNHRDMFNPHPTHHGYVVCPSTEKGRRYIRESVQDIFARVPRLGGLMMISNGERNTTCLSMVDAVTGERDPGCARCDQLEPWKIYGEFAGTIVDGIRAAGSKAELISWFYQPWVRPERAPWVADCARHAPDGVIFAYNFESGALKEQLGRYRNGGDYWLSFVGPAEGFRQVGAAARDGGRVLGAKIQVCNSHECATIPYVPVPGLLYRKYREMKDAGVSTVLQCWYFGNYPGLMNRAAGMLSHGDLDRTEDEFLMRLAKSEWGDDAIVMAQLWKRFSDAYANYPLSNDMQYYGPFHAGIAWPLFPEVCLEPLARTWKPQDLPSGDTIGECLENHTIEEAVLLARRMARGASTVDACGEDVLDALARRHAAEPERLRDIGVMRAMQILFESGADILEFYSERSRAIHASRFGGDFAAARAAVSRMGVILEREVLLTKKMLPLAVADSRLGFHSEAEAHQFHPRKLEWRLGELAAAKRRLAAIAAEVDVGRPYPESNFEKAAVSCIVGGGWTDLGKGRAFRVRDEANGDFTVELKLGNANDRLTLYTHDACGTSWFRSVVVKGTGEVLAEPLRNSVTPQHEVVSECVVHSDHGPIVRFTLSANGWGGRVERRPGYLQWRSNGLYDSCVWPKGGELTNPESRLNIGHVEGHTFGRVIRPHLSRQ